MSPNIFGERLLGPTEIQLRHKQRKLGNVDRDDTAPTTLSLNDNLYGS